MVFLFSNCSVQPPEVLRSGAQATVAGDVYAFGMLLYVMAAAGCFAEYKLPFGSKGSRLFVLVSTLTALSSVGSCLEKRGKDRKNLRAGLETNHAKVHLIVLVAVL